MRVTFGKNFSFKWGVIFDHFPRVKQIFYIAKNDQQSKLYPIEEIGTYAKSAL
jgi:hypothetical protein